MMSKTMNKKIENGFTLIEALIAAVILAFGALALAQMMAVGVGMNVRTKDDTELATITTEYLEKIYQVGYRNLVVGGDLNPTAGSEDPAYSDLDVFPEADVPADSDHHVNATRYNVYWLIADGPGTICTAPYKVITVRVVSERIQGSTNSPAREMTMSVHLIDQFSF
jgi:prepilin-type N-terminal cleavage/methylation domain-containing protein